MGAVRMRIRLREGKAAGEVLHSTTNSVARRLEINVAPASRRLYRGRLALGPGRDSTNRQFYYFAQGN